jgi:type II secretory pathway component PulF
MPNNFINSDPLIAALQLLLLGLTFLIGLALEAAIVYALYFLLTLPMRRNERTRLFLDLLELGLKEGQTPEHAIISAGMSNDICLGARFHLLAAYLQNGKRLGAALSEVPRLLPPQVAAMLKVGERMGDVRKVLPACRRLANDGVSQVRGALNYVLILAFVVSPAAIVIPLILKVLVIPKFKEVFAGMLEGSQLPAFTQTVMASSDWVLLLQIAVIVATWFLLFAYLGGPRVYGYLRAVLPGMPDWIHFHLPWRRKRLQRDFSAMLAVLLDAQVPENEAVALAADSTANTIIKRRARKICELLAGGLNLPEAIRALDETGELQWRLANALRRGRGFLSALNGWHEALDAKAFQQEQAAAQITTTALVLFNGLIVACIVIGLFLPLIALLNAATLW